MLRTGTRSACARIRPSVSGSSGSAKGFTTPRSHTPVTRAADKAFPWPRHPAIRRLGCPSAGQTRLLESCSSSSLPSVPAPLQLLRTFTTLIIAIASVDSTRLLPPPPLPALLQGTAGVAPGPPPPTRRRLPIGPTPFAPWLPLRTGIQRHATCKRPPDTGAGAGATAANCNPPATAASPRRSAPARPSQGSGPLKGEQSALEACPRRYEVALVLRPVQARRCGHVFHVFLLALASELAFTHTLLE